MFTNLTKRITRFCLSYNRWMSLQYLDKNSCIFLWKWILYWLLFFLSVCVDGIECSRAGVVCQHMFRVCFFLLLFILDVSRWFTFCMYVLLSHWQTKPRLVMFTLIQYFKVIAFTKADRIHSDLLQMYQYVPYHTLI